MKRVLTQETVMKVARVLVLVLTTVECTILMGSATVAQENARPRFAPPKRFKVGDVYLGENRTYPSPVLHDYDGDGRRDIVVGDLAGRLTVALGVSSDGARSLGPEKPVEDRNGKPLRFHNW
jgi:hypothetical protein